MTIATVTPAEVAAARDRWLLLDVREPWELTIASVDGAVSIPLGQLPSRHEELARDADIAVLCHSGVRSAHATAFLNDSGFPSVYNVSGGIDRWSIDVDPDLPRY